MSLIVKIMCAQRGNDSHPRHGYRVFANVQEVEFEEPSNLHGQERGAHVHLTFRRDTEAAPEETTSIALTGNVYVMNEAGKTISTFELAGGARSAPLGPDPEAIIRAMAERFLSWRLPADFNPDGGISFKAEFNENTPHPMRHEPMGTNLFDLRQAMEMVRYMAAGVL